MSDSITLSGLIPSSSRITVVSGNAPTSSAVVGTVIFIDLAPAWFVVNESTAVPFFCIVIVELLTVGNSSFLA